jgi:hypothetical protein
VVFDLVSLNEATGDASPLDLRSPYLDIAGYVQIGIPRFYYYFSSLAQEGNPQNYGQEIIPFILTLVSAVLATCKRLLSMRYNLKQGYIRKMKLFVSEKIKILDEAEINLQTVDKSGNLLPRKISRNSHVIKRFRAIHEGGARRNVI